MKLNLTSRLKRVAKGGSLSKFANWIKTHSIVFVACNCEAIRPGGCQYCCKWPKHNIYGSAICAKKCGTRPLGGNRIWAFFLTWGEMDRKVNDNPLGNLSRSRISRVGS